MTVLFIVGLCSLGLPGFSGFVAEMTVFMGAWQNVEIAYRIATIAACMSIVVTAVYILRAVGKTAMGPASPIISVPGDRSIISDAKWNEKLAAALLVAGIVAIGIAPFWLNDLIKPGSEVIIQKLSQLVK